MTNTAFKKGIILAGGQGTRLRPLTDFVCKQLLPVYDKPVIFYALSSLMLAGIKEILIVSTPKDTPVLKHALGSGSNFGIQIQYAVQDSPRGIADALIIAEPFLAGESCCLLLGDNLLHIANFTDLMGALMQDHHGATVFGFPVQDPEHFGVIEFDVASGQVLSLQEKPQQPKSNYAAIGLYLYDGSASERAKQLSPSARGELEITDLNNLYLADKELHCQQLSRGNLWIDVGRFESLADAGQLVRLVETRLGLKIGSPEEAAFNMGFINHSQLAKLASNYTSSPYGAYLKHIAEKGPST